MFSFFEENRKSNSAELYCHFQRDWTLANKKIVVQPSITLPTLSMPQICLFFCSRRMDNLIFLFKQVSYISAEMVSCSSYLDGPFRILNLKGYIWTLLDWK